MRTMQTNFTKKLFLTGTISLLLSLTACNTVNISMQKPKQYLIDGRANIITSGQLSNNSIGMLRMAGAEDKTCIADLAKCLSELDNNQFVKYTPRQLALYAELHYAKAQQLQETKNCKKQKATCENNYQQQLLEAIRYSYVYLFFQNNNHQQDHFNNELDIQMQDIYHTASKNLIDKLSSQVINNNQVNIDIENYKITVVLPKHLLKKLNNKKSLPIDSLTATSTLKMTGLNSVSRRHGIGVSYVAQGSNRHTNNLKNALLAELANKNQPSNQTQQRIYPTGNLLLTAIVQPQGNDINSILKTNSFSLRLYDPYQTHSVIIRNHSYPLATNFSANYALWVNENQLRGVSIMNMLRNDKGIPLPQLYMLEPYNPNKRIIIMVHGLASSPFTWINLTNDLLNDERLRENYQVWQVFYSTNLPMLENRYYIQQVIEQAYQQTVGTAQVPANQHSVIIAHSMGSVISRMMLSNDNLNTKIATLNPKNKQKPLAKIYQQKLQLHPLSSVDTAIFISAPFRGTNFADRWYSKALRDVIKLPNELTKKKSANPIINQLFLKNGASQLSDKSAFMQLTTDIKINKNVSYHSIIGDYEGVLDVVNRRSSQHKNSDGIVPYNSSHLEGAKSETVIEGGHTIHSNPKTILQLRKILHRQLDKTQ